jgi:hypothetical protein
MKMEPQPRRPLRWWEEYLGLKIRFHLLKPKRVWETAGAYLTWIVPSALLSLLASIGAMFGVQLKQVPVQARPKEVHVPSQNQYGIVTLEDPNLFNVSATSANVVSMREGTLQRRGYLYSKVKIQTKERTVNLRSTEDDNDNKST